MDRRKVKILKEVLAEVSSLFEEIEKFVKERLQKICSQEKISVEQVIYLLVSSLPLMTACFFSFMLAGLLTFSIKNSCVLCN